MSGFDEIKALRADDIFHALCNVGPIVTHDDLGQEVQHDIWKLQCIAHLVECALRSNKIGTVGELFRSLGVLAK